MRGFTIRIDIGINGETEEKALATARKWCSVLACPILKIEVVEE